jgi:hypothetical protein
LSIASTTPSPSRSFISSGQPLLLATPATFGQSSLLFLTPSLSSSLLINRYINDAEY